jgi:hypothetical protein
VKKVTFKSLSEEELASYQTLQTGNNCTLHAISAALDLLCNYRIAPQKLSEEINRLWWRGRFYRIVPNWAVTPPMQVKIVNYLASSRGLSIFAQLRHTSPEILRNLLYDESIAALVTIYWLPRQAPAIYQGTRNVNYNAIKSMGGHTMLFASFNPDHLTVGSKSTPWGFINSWADSSPDLFWMEDSQFRKAWDFSLLNLGSNATVIISKFPHHIPIA